MKAKGTRYLTSASAKEGFPAPECAEIAFAGRSNVGKSTLINTLVGNPKLARTSNTPGRTRLLNWFEVQPQKGPLLHFVDLPGYGYARVPREMRDSWRPLVEGYLVDRESLGLVLLLMDARRGAQEEELDLLDWLVECGIPVLCVMTKSDKLSKSKRKPAAMAIKKELGLERTPVMCSSTTKDGLDDLWRIIFSVVA